MMGTRDHVSHARAEHFRNRINARLASIAFLHANMAFKGYLGLCNSVRLGDGVTE
jgi:hypothetical protein